MDTNAYKKAVATTLQPKLVKAGLRHLTKTTPRAAVAHAVLGLKTESGELLSAVNSYLLGEQLKADQKLLAKNALAAYGYYLIMGARVLKSKTPSANKKVKLVGRTRTQAILALDANSTAMLALIHQYLTATSPDDKLESLDDSLIADLTTLFDAAIALYWPLVLDTLGETPDVVFQHDFDIRKEHYPAGFFDPKPKAEPKPPELNADGTEKPKWKPGQKKTPPADAPATPAAGA